MFWGVNSLESNERNLHGKESSSNVENTVGDVESGWHFSNDQQKELLYKLSFIAIFKKGNYHKDGNNVNDESITTPWSNHV